MMQFTVCSDLYVGRQWTYTQFEAPQVCDMSRTMTVEAPLSAGLANDVSVKGQAGLCIHIMSHSNCNSVISVSFCNGDSS